MFCGQLNTIMKIAVCVIFLAFVAVSIQAAEINNDGRPGCRTDVEMRTLIYRNFWDPTAYWKCERRSEAAEAVRCPDGTAFQDKLKQCVSWVAWVWEDFIAPPSAA